MRIKNGCEFLSGLSRCAVLVLILIGLGRAAADNTAINFSSRLYQGASGAGNEMIGWEFTPTVNLSVTQLGLYDGHPSGGFVESHVIGIWDSSRNLLGSAQMPLGEAAPLSGSFRFVSSPTILLNAGQHYIIGAYMPAPVSDYFEVFAPGDSRVSVNADINFVSERFDTAPSGLTFPTYSVANQVGYFGPNFTFVEVPEPGVACFGIAGMLCAWGARRRLTRRDRG